MSSCCGTNYKYIDGYKMGDYQLQGCYKMHIHFFIDMLYGGRNLMMVFHDTLVVMQAWKNKNQLI